LRKIKVVDVETGTVYDVTITGDDTSTGGQIIDWRMEEKRE
jgi:hypothetical protein